MSTIESRQKVGRNDSCPCGSGKKYKHCCLREEERVAYESPWRKQHDATGRLGNEMLRFVESRFGDIFLQAWQDFNQETFPQTIDKFTGEEEIFMPYLLFDWDPNRSTRMRRRRRHPGIVAQGFIEKRAKRLGELENSILHRNIETPLSFYEVLNSKPGFGVKVRDVLIGGEIQVEEHSASLTLRTGDLIYGQLCRLPEVTVFGRLAPTPLRPDRKPELVRLRIWLRAKAAKQNRQPNEADLIQYEEKIRTEYLNARDAAYAPITLANTDGELLVLHTIRYQVGSAQVAFDALAPLAYGETKEDLLDCAEFSPGGEMLRVEFDWRKPGNTMHRDWDNTIMAHIRIEGRTLTVEVNSEERASKIKEEIEKRLGFMAVHQGTRTHTQEDLMESARQKNLNKSRIDDKVELSIADPEAHEIVKNMLLSHAEAWVDTQIPALGWRTPREAVADPDGREAVEGLLLGWERRNQESSDPVMRSFDVGIVRKKLGL